MVKGVSSQRPGSSAAVAGDEAATDLIAREVAEYLLGVWGVTEQALVNRLMADANIPVCRGAHAPDIEWLVEALLRWKWSDSIARHRLKLFTSEFGSHIQFFGTEDTSIRDVSAKTLVNGDREALAAFKRVIKTIAKSIKPGRNDRTCRATPGRDVDAKQSKKKPGGHSKMKKQTNNTAAAPAAKKKGAAAAAATTATAKPARPAKSNSAAKPARATAAGAKPKKEQRVFAGKDDFKRKDSTQYKAFKLIVDAGEKGLTRDELEAAIKKNIPEEKKPRALANYCFTVFSKRGRTKIKNMMPEGQQSAAG